MRIKIYKMTYDYLHKNLSIERPDLMLLIKLQQEEGTQLIIELNEDTANKVRDWAGEKLQKEGFDKDYNLTEQGEYLESIIDLLYI